jgi:hypothetical protein
VTPDDVVAKDLSVEALVEAIFAATTDSKRDKNLRLEHLERFSRPVIAERTRSVYGSAIAGNKRIIMNNRPK